VNRDEYGQIVSGFARDMKEAQQIAKEIEKTGKFKEVAIEERPLAVDFGTLQTLTNFGPELRRTVLKMCRSLSTLMPGFDPHKTVAIGKLLRNMSLSLGTRTYLDLRTHEALDCLCTPLAHVIYVEFGRDYAYGIVQFFGHDQLFCKLFDSPTNDPRAMLATLDPVTQSEKFIETAPLGIAVPRILLKTEEMKVAAFVKMEKLRKAAIARGAKNIPNAQHLGFIASSQSMFLLVSSTTERTVFICCSNTLDWYLGRHL
jgi:hypothetical protein